ncbi:MAG: DEAD/DEAH box helicase [Erysipelotrichaceae bacterium]|nr:DEAD/DEAH box helicase [Erysipelotrichaceae bacterium]
MKFKDMCMEPAIQKALDMLGYEKPTLVQENVIPCIQKQQNVIVRAKTGSGKTAAYAIPILHTVVWEENKPQCLVLVPTRELAMQIRDNFTKIGLYKRIKVVTLVGKQPYHFQEQDLRQKTHIVVGTPGRVWEHIQRGTLDVSRLQYFVLDEVDEMLHIGFLPTVESILSNISSSCCKTMFSATISSEIQELAKTYMQDANMIEIQKEGEVPSNIEHGIYHVHEQEKKDFLMKLLVKEKPMAAILFVRTQENVEDLYTYLEEFELSVCKLHGGMLQEERMENIKAFRKGKKRFLVASDVAARGIDIMDISHVINYDFPLEVESYIHRMGRTGRKEKKGTVISFVTRQDKIRKERVEAYIGEALPQEDKKLLQQVEVLEEALQSLRRLFLEREKEEYVDKDILMLYINSGKKKKTRPQDFVGALCEIEGICAEDIGTIQIQDYHSYVQILNGKGQKVCNTLQKVKGKKVKVEIAKDHCS